MVNKKERGVPAGESACSNPLPRPVLPNVGSRGCRRLDSYSNSPGVCHVVLHLHDLMTYTSSVTRILRRSFLHKLRDMFRLRAHISYPAQSTCWQKSDKRRTSCSKMQAFAAHLSAAIPSHQVATKAHCNLFEMHVRWREACSRAGDGID